MAAPKPPPTLSAIIVGTALTAFIGGYFIGIASSLNIIPIPCFLTAIFPALAREPHKKSLKERYEDEEESSEEEVELDETALDHAPNWSNAPEQDKRDGLVFEPKKEKKSKKKLIESITEDDWKMVDDTGEDCKLVLVARTDLGMTKGKIAAQCSHATLACYKTMLRLSSSSSASAASAKKILQRWEREGQAKVAVQVTSEDDMDLLYAKAISLGLVAEVISDAGRTQIAAGSRTVLGVGPAPKSAVDAVTGGLKLL